MKMDPVFLGKGEELVFTLQESPTQMSLMRLRLADGSVERLHPSAQTSEFEATFTPDARHYAFVQTRGNLNLKLVIKDTRQSKENVFDPGSGFVGMRRPSMAPDGSRVIFSIPADSGQQIHSVSDVGQDRKQLTQSGFNSWPAYSPDGKQIAFGANRDGSYKIHVMDADGDNKRLLTRGRCLDARPAWSPDGRQLAFTSNRDANYEIHVMNADGSRLRRVTDNPERDDYATWHPDGKRLAFVAERAGQFDLYLVDVPE
jgi:Tol biopolymer transport system component